MRTRIVLACSLISLLLLAALWQLPAYQAYRLFGVDQRLQLSGLSGTAWRGNAAQLVVGTFPMGAVKWRLRLSELLRLSLAAEVEITGPDGSARGVVSRPVTGGGTRFSDVVAALPASWLQIVLQEPLLQLKGRVDLKMQHLDLDEAGSISALQGRMVWRDASLGGGMATPLGDLAVDWRTDGASLLGELSDAGGPLSMSGQVIVTGGRYRVAARLAAQAENLPLKQALAVLGPPDPDGWLSLNIAGPMIPIGDLLQ